MTNLEINKEFFEGFLPQFKYLDFLGQGAFAKVYLIQNEKNKIKMAVKKVSCFGMCEYQKQSVLNQVKILSNINHPNIINFNSCIYDSHEDNIYILIEYANGGDLMNYINKSNNYIKQNIIWRVIADIAQALNYLHKKGIIHRDVKPANILIQGETFKLADMNISKIVQKNGAITYTKLGTPLYTSPQMTNLSKQKGYDQKCDVWSLGVVVYQLCCLKNPFNLESLNQLTKNTNRNIFKIPMSYSQTLSNLVDQMLQKNPEKRISIRYIMQICQMQGIKLHRETHSITQFKTIVFPQSSQRWINITSQKNMNGDISKYLRSNESSNKTKQFKKQNGCSVIKENLLQLTIDQRLKQESSIVVNEQEEEILDQYGLKLFDLSKKNILKTYLNSERKGIHNHSHIFRQKTNDKYLQKNKFSMQKNSQERKRCKIENNNLYHNLHGSKSKQNEYKFQRSKSREANLLKQKQHYRSQSKNNRVIAGKYIKLSKQFRKNS